MDKVEAVTAEHRGFLRSLVDAGKLIASGPLVPRTGGMIIFQVESVEEARQLLAADPFAVQGIAVYEFRGWSPTLGASRFD